MRLCGPATEQCTRDKDPVLRRPVSFLAIVDSAVNIRDDPVSWTITRPCRSFKYRAGAIAVGIVFALRWRLPKDRSEPFYLWYCLVRSLLDFLANTVCCTPWVALNDQRTRPMGVQNFIAHDAESAGYAARTSRSRPST